MNYYYSQRDPRWADRELGASGLTMRDFGCVVTSCAAMLSYFFDREVLPSTLLDWLNANQGFTHDGLLYWNKITEFSGGMLRYGRKEPGDVTYTVRQCLLGRFNHWLIDDPVVPGMVIDPLPGDTREYRAYNWTGRNRAFYGKPVRELPVDKRYGQKRTWSAFLREQAVAFNPWLRSKLGRPPTHREINAFAYGLWDYEAVTNPSFDQWLHMTKPQYQQG